MPFQATDFKSVVSTYFTTLAVLVPFVGFELTTYALQVRCSTKWAKRAWLAGLPGFEPGTNGLTVRCYTNWAISQNMAEYVGIEPTHPLLSDGLAIHCLNRSANTPMAGDKGLEPLNGGIKIRCLTNLANPQQKLLSWLSGVSYENRTRDSGITTRGFATKLTSPYRNTH